MNRVLLGTLQLIACDYLSGQSRLSLSELAVRLLAVFSTEDLARFHFRQRVQQSPRDSLGLVVFEAFNHDVAQVLHFGHLRARNGPVEKGCRRVCEQGSVVDGVGNAEFSVVDE